MHKKDENKRNFKEIVKKILLFSSFDIIMKKSYELRQCLARVAE